MNRAADLVVAGSALVVAAPLLAVSALAIKIEDGGPVFYAQRRVGREGGDFALLKLRTMVPDAEGLGAGYAVDEGDPRITRVGRVLRRLSLDELPQLWNVVRGDMSFVGPRPERPEFVEQFEAEIQGYRERFKVRPGLTGYAQVNGEYHTSPTTKLKYDLAYMYNRCCGST